jgi:hypothetical protein
MDLEKYSSWAYKKIGGNVVAEIVTGKSEVEARINKGWKLSPAEFIEQSEREAVIQAGGTDEGITQACDEKALLMNRLLNFDLIEDKDTLQYIAEELHISSSINWSEAGRRTLAHVKKDLRKELVKLGMLDERKTNHH